MYFLKWFLSKNFFNSEVPKPGGVELSKGQHFNLILLFSIFFVFKLSSVEILSNSSECVNMGTGALSKKADITILGTTALKLKPIRFMWPKEVLCAHRVTLKKNHIKKVTVLCALSFYFFPHSWNSIFPAGWLLSFTPYTNSIEFYGHRAVIDIFCTTLYFSTNHFIMVVRKLTSVTKK